MAGHMLEQGGDLVQRASDAAPGYDLKFNGLHDACRGQNKNRSEQEIDQPFAHDASLLAAEVRATTALHLRSEAKDAVARLREQLTPAEQSLLVLRIDRGLSWSEVASVMSTPAEHLDAQTVAKRFQRVKAKLRELAEAAGLLERS